MRGGSAVIRVWDRPKFSWTGTLGNIQRVLPILCMITAMTLVPIPTRASSGGPNGSYQDLCITAYPTGCTQITYNAANGVHYLWLVDATTDSSTSNQVQTFISWWDTLFQDWWNAGAQAFPYIAYETASSQGLPDSCQFNGTYTLTVCNGSNPSPDRGLTYPNNAGNVQLAGTYSVIDTSQPTSNAQGAVCHEVMLGVGLDGV